jgi:tetratricopeptide (TPR) repeat protein
LGNAKAAEQWYTSALAHYRSSRDRLGAAAVLMNLGAAAADLRLDFEAARTRFLEALHTFRELGPPESAATALAKLGEVCAHCGDYETALSYAAESLAIFERTRSYPHQGWQLANMARYRIERREWDRAASALRDAHVLLQEYPEREYAAVLLEAGFCLASDLERHELAARIAGHLHAYREREAVPRTPSAQHQYDRRLQRARAKLGASAFDEAFASGPSHALDAFVAEIVRA